MCARGLLLAYHSSTNTRSCDHRRDSESLPHNRIVLLLHSFLCCPVMLSQQDHYLTDVAGGGKYTDGDKEPNTTHMFTQPRTANRIHSQTRMYNSSNFMKYQCVEAAENVHAG